VTDNALYRWFDATILDIGRNVRWSYRPKLMAYLAYCISGITSVVVHFFITDYHDLSAASPTGLSV